MDADADDLGHVGIKAIAFDVEVNALHGGIQKSVSSSDPASGIAVSVSLPVARS